MYGNLKDYERIFTSLDIHHVGILATDVPTLPWHAQGYIPEFECHCFLYGLLEFVRPSGGVLLNRLNESGERLHHLAYETPNIRNTREELMAIGLEFLRKQPVRGIGNTLVDFILPRGRGVLIEIVQVLRPEEC